ncbi:methyltransferase domain-containing protein [Amphritea pacifica]|uniref:Methyltransferase domain-containing protein n=1 Tax=Amphritea pacifica TaxID=2811233 RepID=A0ABS2W4N9_9GAMM|nr:methyltransferase domain-containing protein [Amphritea pacifica]MBN0986678.1 methyltransferase domain-containing protein [Amphritea pacifica]MBN1007270.1 methyltransferase domain-containing protein [Amphritea pacifica]
MNKPLSDATLSDEELLAAKAYEELHVPALFRQFAPIVASTAQISPGQRVLDVACGTGILARTVATTVADPGSVSGLDLSPGMLAIARQLAPAIDWQQGAAESLPFADNSFDAVVCQFGLMFFQNRQAALKEMMRVLAPGGRLVVAVWDALINSQAYPDEVDMLQRLAGQAAADALRAPFVLGNPDQITELLTDAGAAFVAVDTHQGMARFPNIKTMVEADLRGWLPVMGVQLQEAQIALILNEAETVLSAFTVAGGQVAFAAPALIASGVKV